MSGDARIAQALLDFCATVAALRDPKTGCPWDLEQDHVSLRRYMIEEAYEAAEAMASGDPAKICEELGDVLLQVVLNAQVAKDQGTFDIADVARTIDAKMHRRHPHVFGTDEERKQRDKAHIKAKWQEIKASENGEAPKKQGVFAAAKGKTPALHQAAEIGKIAARSNFDWDDAEGVLEQVLAEVQEMRDAFRARKAEPKKLAAELGDVFFSLAQLCRHLGLDPEIVALDGNHKFLARFERVERLAEARGIDVTKAARETLEELWQQAKREER